MLLLLIFLEITFFLSDVAALSIMTQSATIVGQASLVVWAREPSDGNSTLVFDLRFVRPVPSSEDVGLALSNIQARSSTQFGTAQVVFPSTGSFQLVAVSGPDIIHLGESSIVDAFQLPIPTPSATPSAKPSSTSSASHPTKNLGAIIGGTIGGVVFLGLLAALVIVYLRRRRQPPTTKKRWTFRRSMMVRPPVLDICHISPTLDISQSTSVEDIEQGLPLNGDGPTSPVVMIASPSGPRPLLKPSLRPLPTPPEPLNPRQEKIAQMMEQVRKQMVNLEKNPTPTAHIMLDDMQKQMSWLQCQMESAWALGLTDVRPLGFAP